MTRFVRVDDLEEDRVCQICGCRRDEQPIRHGVCARCVQEAAEYVHEVHRAECSDCGEPTSLIELRLVYDPDDGFGSEAVCPVCFDRRLDGHDLASE